MVNFIIIIMVNFIIIIIIIYTTIIMNWRLCIHWYYY